MQCTPTFTGFQNTGHVIIPVGVRAFSINVVSGSAFINNTLFLAGASISTSLPDSKLLFGSSIAVGMTGTVNKTTVYYNT